MDNEIKFDEIIDALKLEDFTVMGKNYMKALTLIAEEVNKKCWKILKNGNWHLTVKK